MISSDLQSSCAYDVRIKGGVLPERSRTSICGDTAYNDLGAVQASQGVAEFLAIHGVYLALSLDERSVWEHIDDFLGQGTIWAWSPHVSWLTTDQPGLVRVLRTKLS